MAGMDDHSLLESLDELFGDLDLPDTEPEKDSGRGESVPAAASSSGGNAGQSTLFRIPFAGRSSKSESVPASFSIAPGIKKRQVSGAGSALKSSQVPGAGSALKSSQVPGAGSASQPFRIPGAGNAPLPFEADEKPDKEWDAGALYLKEEADPPDEEDVQCYMIRKKLRGVFRDDELERMERVKPEPVSDWGTGSAVRMEAGELYLALETGLSGGRLSDQDAQNMVLMRGKEDAPSEGMCHFYPLFTLLQDNPSRRRIQETLSQVLDIPREDPCSKGIFALKDAIEEEVNRQDAFNEQQDRKYRTRQAELDRKRDDAKSRYDSAARRTDRWKR